jgi:integrase
VAIDTGCRLGELLGGQQQLNGDRLHLWKTKNLKPRTLPLTPRAQAILEARLPWSINEKRLRTAWEKAKDAMGLSHDKGFVFHALRHTCCTRLCRMRPAINIVTIKKWMGHERIETTMRYAQIADDMLEEARDMLSHGVGQEPRRVWGGVGQEPPGCGE